MPNTAPPPRGVVRRGPARRSTVRLAAALVPAALIAACGGGDKATGPGDGVVGTYALQSVNGQSLPMQLGTTDDGRAVAITTGSVDLRSDKSYVTALTFRFTGRGQSSSQSQQDTGTYTASGSSVTLRSTDGTTTTATVAGGRLTSSVPLDGGGTLTFVFQK